MASLVTQGLSPRLAIVISSEKHQYGLARMASIHLEIKNLELEIFTDLAEAPGVAAKGRRGPPIRERRRKGQ